MPFPSQSLNLPAAEETVAFRALVGVLENDPVLQSLGTRIVSWTGGPDDLEEPTGLQPYLMLTPGGMASGWETEGQHRMPMTVSLLAVVAGTNVDEVMNFHGAIRRALFPADPEAADTIQEIMNAAGVTQGTLTAPAYGVKVDDATGSRLLVATGSIELYLLINT